MNEYARKWWVWGVAGAFLWPVALLAVDGATQHLQAEAWRPYIGALCLAFGGGVGLIAVPALPVRPWLRIVLFFFYIPLFLLAARIFAPWAGLV